MVEDTCWNTLSIEHQHLDRLSCLGQALHGGGPCWNTQSIEHQHLDRLSCLGQALHAGGHMLEHPVHRAPASRYAIMPGSGPCMVEDTCWNTQSIEHQHLDRLSCPGSGPCMVEDTWVPCDLSGSSEQVQSSQRGQHA